LAETMEINVELGEKSYPIFIGSNILNTLGDEMKKLKLKGKVLVMTNPQVERHYGKIVQASLEKKGYEVRMMPIPSGEEFKNIEMIKKIYDTLISCNYERSSTIVALGGGVIGDIAGYAAGTYQRGINFVQVPTSLLAQVDSAVGGKTGINHDQGKNMIGVFYQPRLVLADVATLKTLPEKEVKSGLAEVIKYGMIKDAKFYKYLHKKLKNCFSEDQGLLDDNEALIEIVTRCCEIKSDIVEEDEKEHGIRAILNFGHTVGHAIETLTNYKKYTHGEAVALGMITATDFSVQKEYIAEEELEKLVELLKEVRLKTNIDFPVEWRKMIELIRHDKKVAGGNIRFILLKKIGRAVVEELKETAALEEVMMKLNQEVMA